MQKTTKKLAVFYAAVPVISFQLLNGLWLNSFPANLSLVIDITFMAVVPLITYFILSWKFDFSLKDIGISFDGDIRVLIEDTVVCTAIFLVAHWVLTNFRKSGSGLAK